MNPSTAKHILSTGKPYLLYGTAWKKDDTASLVSQALHAGFRFIDTACQPKHYNEAGVGLGIKTAIDSMGLSREDIFVQTKFTSLSVSCYNLVVGFNTLTPLLTYIYVLHFHLQRDKIRQTYHMIEMQFWKIKYAKVYKLHYTIYKQIILIH